jgi:hypothetical protein
VVQYYDSKKESSYHACHYAESNPKKKAKAAKNELVVPVVTQSYWYQTTISFNGISTNNIVDDTTDDLSPDVIGFISRCNQNSTQISFTFSLIPSGLSNKL